MPSHVFSGPTKTRRSRLCSTLREKRTFYYRITLGSKCQSNSFPNPSFIRLYINNFILCASEPIDEIFPCTSNDDGLLLEYIFVRRHCCQIAIVYTHIFVCSSATSCLRAKKRTLSLPPSLILGGGKRSCDCARSGKQLEANKRQFPSAAAKRNCR
jgi:hypothetical protein